MKNYRFLSNIQPDFSLPLFIEIPITIAGNEESGIVKFCEGDESVFCSFLTLRSHEDNHLLFQLGNYGNLLYVPAGEVFSIEGIAEVNKIRLMRSTGLSGQDLSTGKFQWIVGF